MYYETKIISLFENGYLTTKKVEDNNIPRFYLTKLVKSNLIKRVARGLYTNNDALETEYILLQNRSKYAAFSNLTSLYLLGYCERIPIIYNLIIENIQNRAKNNLFLVYYKNV